MIPDNNFIKFIQENASTSARFTYIENYTKKTDESEVNLQIISGLSYSNVLHSSLSQLAQVHEVKVGGQNFNETDPLFTEAKNEIRDSLARSITGDNLISNNKIDPYKKLGGGFKIHLETGVVYIDGKKLKETVIKEGKERKEKNSSLKTKVKDQIRKNLDVSKWRSFALYPNNFKEIRFENKVFSTNQVYVEI